MKPRNPLTALPLAALACAIGTTAFADGGPRAVDACFAPGTPMELIEELARQTEGLEISLAADAPGFQFTETRRWSATATNPGPLRLGDPTTITWSVVPDGTPIEQAYVGESTAGSNLRAWLDSLYGGEATWLPLFQSVFDRWGALTGVTYRHEPNDDGAGIGSASQPGRLGVRGDVRISGHRIDGNANILAYNYYPNNGDMVLDTYDSVFNDRASNSLKLRNTLAHEHGHGLGFSHVCPIADTKLMEPWLSSAFDGPQLDDTLAGNRGYGDDLEPNDSTAAPRPLGTMGSGDVRTISGVSVDDEGDSDFFSFVVAADVRVSATIRPVGTTYTQGPQSGNCTSGSSFNALAQQNLGVAVIDRDGSRIIDFADVNGAGSSETLSGVSLATAGTYYVQAYGSTADKVQLYELEISVSGGTAAATVYESADPALVVSPTNRIGTASSSPFEWTLTPGSLWFYQLDDGTGNPARIRLVRGGPGIRIHFP